MTIARYINNFISEYLADVMIDTNHLGGGADKYGLFKTPSREVTRNIDGSLEITEHYQFFATQANVSEADRKDSDEFLENLTYWVDDYSTTYEYPAIDGGRTVNNISMTGCPYPMEVENNNEVVYQILLSITYTRESEV